MFQNQGKSRGCRSAGFVTARSTWFVLRRGQVTQTDATGSELHLVAFGVPIFQQCPKPNRRWRGCLLGFLKSKEKRCVLSLLVGTGGFASTQRLPGDVTIRHEVVAAPFPKRDGFGLGVAHQCALDLGHATGATPSSIGRPLEQYLANSETTAADVRNTSEFDVAPELDRWHFALLVLVFGGLRLWQRVSVFACFVC